MSGGGGHVPARSLRSHPVKKWIQEAIQNPGALRKSLGAKAGHNIPAKKLAAAAKKPGVTGKRARLAQTLRKING
jgi:hypothetical protein